MIFIDDVIYVANVAFQIMGKAYTVLLFGLWNSCSWETLSNPKETVADFLLKHWLLGW